MVSKIAAHCKTVKNEGVKQKPEQGVMRRGKDQLQQQQQQYETVLQCNKGKVSKFKRSSSIGEEDAASSAILLLACIACAPPSI
ncbi:hypothetical protein ACLOJK_012075 [Asimina triloba]